MSFKISFIIYFCYLDSILPAPPFLSHGQIMPDFLWALVIYSCGSCVMKKCLTSVTSHGAKHWIGLGATFDFLCIKLRVEFP